MSNFKTESRVRILVASIFMLLFCMSTTSLAEVTYKPEEQSLSRHIAAPDWFRDAKLGIYFHWGPYTVAAHGNEWYPRWMHFDYDAEAWEGRVKGYHFDLLDWHTEKFGHPSEFGYHDMIPLFTGEHFDAESWAQLFEDSGARFAGPVAMHHDGFAMWDSKVTPWNAKAKGPKRDITGELATALRKRDIKLITSFHHARHLQRYRGQSPMEAMQRFGDRKSYHPFWNSHYPWIEGLPTSSEDPVLRLLYGNMPEEEWLEEFWLATLKEVIDNYQPDIIWFDTWLDQIPASKRYEFAAYFLNAADKTGQEVMITHKHEDLPPEFSVEDLEKGRRSGMDGAAWLTDDTLSTGSWSYTEDLKLKSSERVIHEFIDIVSKNGQLLLNISPKADGTIPDNQRAVLMDLGGWLKVNGEAIYGTRPWTLYGEGPSQMAKGGHFTKQVTYTAKDIRFTTKEDVMYAITLGTPVEETVIAALSLNNSLLGSQPIRSVEALSGDYVESWKQERDGLRIKLKKGAPEQIAYAFRIK